MNKFLSFVFMFIAHFSVSLMSNLIFFFFFHIGETLISSVLFVLIFSAICHFVGKWKRESWFSGKLSYGQILISKGKIRMKIKHYNTTVIIVDILKNQKLIHFLSLLKTLPQIENITQLLRLKKDQTRWRLSLIITL